ncbi:hypothetical protein N431DRAFT_465132 [Stipitochalara longipes BDJ]|nr:hypothetical protein N431DRAFT_465132 [Stipitochalara longipes BDJ]
MATTALWLSEITDLWTMSSSISSVLQKMTTIIPVQIRESFGELDMPHYLVWALFCLSAGIFTFSAVCIGIKRKRVFWHEWSGMILLLGIGAFAQVTPFEESLVILPMSTSIILTITHLWYHSSTKALFLEGIPEFKDCDERDTDYSYK